jgi:aspartate carbamoyltransferase
MQPRSFIDFDDISADEWESLYSTAESMKKTPSAYTDSCRGRIMATLFYEPSTRTQMSFQAAMMRLGGSVIGFSDPNNSSVIKGESFRDTVKIVAGYSDIVVIRSPLEGAAFAASLYSPVPIINAGDGSHLHPTQTLMDIMTIREIKGTLSGLKIGLCGDLLNGRTVHSLSKALSKSGGNKFYLISTDELKIPEYIRELLTQNGGEVVELASIEECIGELDILYMTRIQRERFKSQEQYEKQSGIYILDPAKMKLAKRDLVVLHPLPKVDEIEYTVDDDERAKYFEQAENGMYIRMALTKMYLSSADARAKRTEKYPLPSRRFCDNARCISNHEKYLPEMITEKGTCAYCEGKIK